VYDADAARTLPRLHARAYRHDGSSFQNEMGGIGGVNDLLPFVVIGLTAGSVYGLAGTGLVLTYKTSGVFNFAYGAIAAVAAFVFYWLWQRQGVDWRIAAFLSILVLGPLMGLLLELLTRMLARVSTEFQVVGMVGLALGISGALTLWSSSWSDTPTALQFPAYLPTETFTVGSVNIGYDQAITMGIALVATILLWLFFRYARLGVAMRAVVDNPDLVNVTGTNPIAVRRWSWMIGTVFAAMSGALLAPTIGLNSLLLILLVVQAFGAAAVGYFSNLPLTYIGGLAIGIASSVSTKYVGSISWLGGLPASLPFIVLFIALLVTPKRLLVQRRTPPPPPPRSTYTAPPGVIIGFAVIVVVALAFVPNLVGNNLSFWTVGLLTVILFLSLGLLVRESGQVSLCQYAFAAVGAAAFCHFAADHGVPWFPALILAGLVAVPVGLIIAVPAIRLSGVFLALATLGFGITLERMLYLQDIMFGPTADGLHATRPSFATSDKDYYYVILGAVVVCSILVVAVVRGRLGRLLLGLRDSPLALDTEGATTNVTRVLVFCISAFLAGIFGALYAGFVGSVTGATFPSFNSLTILAVVVLAVGGAPWYAVSAAAFFSVIPSYIDIENIQSYIQIFFGLAVVFVGLRATHPPTVPMWVRNVLDFLGGRKRKAAEPAVLPVPTPAIATPVVHVGVTTNGQSDGHVETPVATPVETSRGLEVVDLTVRFGGLVAVDSLSLDAPVGRITGLIGPNGAGKTTTFNAACGLVRTNQGRVLIHGTNVSRYGPASRARRGLGRTFQRAELWNSLSVGENVALGREAAMGGRSMLGQLVARPGQRKAIRESAESAMELTGITALRDRQAALLTSGERRLVELARALAGVFDVILLDEPSSGLDVTETERFGDVLRHVVTERGTGLLLVEHDMALVMEVCEYIYVMDFGRVIFSGNPREVRESEIVQAAYLGSDEIDVVPDPV
jgi:ABC-type branched-subunit amino acid transport system ATPase component/branched-subunit amino acid ABC-type transport system permease component